MSISGSPYHMRLVSFVDVTDPTDPDDLGGGNQDRSLSAAAVIFPATITITKDAIPNSLQNFAFTTTGTGLTNFSLDDERVWLGETIRSATRRSSGHAFDQKTITEAAVAGWRLTLA